MPLQPVLKQLLAAQKANKKKPKKPKKWLFPASQEREYIREMYSLTSVLRSLIQELLIPQLESLIVQANENTPDQPRSDDFISDLFRIMDTVRRLVRPKIIETERDAVEISRDINAFNALQFQKMTSALFSLDLFIDEPWLSDQLTLFATQNSQLINSLVETEIERVSGIVQRGFQQGLPYKTVSEEIQETFGITRRHAKLIARDQTVKLNASLTKLRQEELGIQTYTWQTSGDERVRSSHRLMDGLIGRWDDPTVYKKPGDKKWRKRSSAMSQLHPGGDVQCRCVSLPNIEDLADG